MATKKRTARGRFAASDEDAEQKPAPKKKAVKRTKNFKKAARTRVAEDWPEIVDELVTKAKKGSYNHTKLLVEVSGIKEEEIEPVRKKKDTMSKILMKKLTEKEAGRKQASKIDGGDG